MSFPPIKKSNGEFVSTWDFILVCLSLAHVLISSIISCFVIFFLNGFKNNLGFFVIFVFTIPRCLVDRSRVLFAIYSMF